MSVDVKGGAGIGVAQEALGVFDVDLVFVEHDGVSVADLVPVAGDAGFLGVGVPEPLELHLFDVAAVLPREDQALAGFYLLQELVHERDHTNAGSGLGFLDVGLVGDMVDGFVHGDGAALQVHIVPGEGQELAAAEAGVENPIGEHAEGAVRAILDALDV